MSNATVPRVGDRIEVTIGPIAHGGHFVARLPLDTGRPVVVFVRHALPEERVLVEITEVDKSFLRGDAVEILVASRDRVQAPCALARPGGCGGCDLQHVSLTAQRRLKAAVVAEQLRRLAGLEREVLVEAVAGDSNGLGWRTRMQYVALPEGRRGLRKHRSHDVIPVETCLIEHPDVRTGGGTNVAESVLSGGFRRSFEVTAEGFWQVHPGAPTALVDTVLGMLEARAGERVLDLYSGVGLFAAFLAEAVGPSGHVLAVESDRQASRCARRNLADLPQVEIVDARVDQVLAGSEDPVDLVVLDPPRAGAKRKVVKSITRRRPRAIAYVACDPAALGRDLAYFAAGGYRLADLRAFDLFPMTSHVECVALLVKSDSGPR